MSIVTELKYTANLDKGVCMTPVTPSFIGGDQEAHRITVDCYRQHSREAVDLSGAGVTAYFVRADGMTIPLVGETKGSKASVLLPAACYAVMGRFSLVIKLSLDDGTADSISTVFWGEGAVSRSRTDVVIDPDSVIPSLEELLAQIAAMEIATNNANAAAGNANQAAADALQNVDEAVARQDEVISQLSEDIAELQNVMIDKSINLYNPELQTEDTISPHYYVDGFPYASTDFDSSWHCTAPIKVKPNKQYFLTLVSDVVGKTAPWGDAGQGVFFYRADDTFISGVTTEAFTTPDETAYLRFNYICNGSYSISLPKVNAYCMLVEGNTRPTEYVPYYVSSIKDKVTALENEVANLVPPIAFEIAEDSIAVVSNYGAKKLEVLLNKHGGNNLFDFKRFSVIEDGVKTEVQSIGTDWHAPFQVKAVNNADGDNINSGNFTGGNHNYTNSDSAGSPNARTTLLKFFADGKEVSNGEGYANNIKIVWTNLVQAYNTQRVDGSGREVLQENHYLTFDGLTWTSEVDLIPLEDIVMRLWYGLQFTGLDASLYPNIRYKGATNRGLYHYDTSSDCGDNTANAMIAFGDTHKLTLGIDREIDLGDSKYYDGTRRFFSVTYGKGYAFIIENQEMYADNIYSLKGYYKFEPIN